MSGITFYLIIYSILTSSCALRYICTICSSVKRILNCTSSRASCGYQVLCRTIIHQITLACWCSYASIGLGYSKRYTSANGIVTALCISNGNSCCSYVGVIRVANRILRCRNSCLAILYCNSRFLGCTVICITGCT